MTGRGNILGGGTISEKGWGEGEKDSMRGIGAQR